MVPLVGRNLVFGVRSVLQHVVLLVGFAVLYLLDLFPDALHDLHEAIQLCLALALGRLDHQGAMNGEGECRSVVAKVHQALSDVALVDA